MNAWLGVAFAELNIRNPVAPAPREASLLVFGIKRGRKRLEKRAIDILERVDIDHSIGLFVDLAGDDWDDAAFRADVKLGRFRTEDISRDVGRLTN